MNPLHPAMAESEWFLYSDLLGTRSCSPGWTCGSGGLEPADTHTLLTNASISTHTHTHTLYTHSHLHTHTHTLNTIHTQPSPHTHTHTHTYTHTHTLYTR